MAGHLLALAAMQVALLFIARMLKRPLTPSVMAAGLILPHAVLAPWILNNNLLLPTVHVQRAFPGAPRVDADSRHAKLNDTVYQFVPWEIEVRRAFAERRLPLWSDRIDGGSSPWANPQAEVLSPVRMLARLVPVEDSMLTALALKMLDRPPGHLAGGAAPRRIRGRRAFWRVVDLLLAGGSWPGDFSHIPGRWRGRRGCWRRSCAWCGARGGSWWSVRHC